MPWFIDKVVIGFANFYLTEMPLEALEVGDDSPSLSMKRVEPV